MKSGIRVLFVVSKSVAVFEEMSQVADRNCETKSLTKRQLHVGHSHDLSLAIE